MKILKNVVGKIKNKRENKKQELIKRIQNLCVSFTYQQLNLMTIRKLKRELKFREKWSKNGGWHR